MNNPPKYGTHIWKINLHLSHNSRADLYSLLSDTEKHHCNAFKTEALKNSYIACRGSLREILSYYEPTIHPKLWHFKTNTYGKPTLSQYHPFHFNMTHTESLAYCVMSNESVCGIDVEECRDVDIDSSFFKHALQDDEQHLVRSLPSKNHANAFTRFWCLKEAHLKAVGVGLSTPMSSVKIPLESHHLVSNEEIFIKENGWNYHLYSPDASNVLALAICSMRSVFIPTFHTIGY